MPPEPQTPVPVRTDGLVLVREPAEGAFTLLMPAGWTNQAHLQREHSLNRVIASAVRPDQAELVHLGDPRLPLFTEPGPFFDPMILQFNPHLRAQPYTPADQFAPDYVAQCFGRAPGFRVTHVGDSPDLGRLAEADARRAGHPARITAAAVTFEHAHQGRPLRCRLHAVVIGFSPVWSADLLIASSAEDVDRVDGLARRMFTSRQFDPGWAAAQQRLHEHRMAMGRQQLDFTRAMTEVQRQGHEQRMRDLHAFGQANTRMHDERMAQMDASHQSWMEGQAATDAGHRGWMDQQARDDATQEGRINAVREEHTVADAAGATYRVDIHHARYFVNKRDNTYIGADAATELRDLRRTHGVNPDDFEEVTVVR